MPVTPPPTPPIVVLLRRLQARPGAPGSDETEVLGRCEGGALAAALDAGARLDAPVVAVAVGPARREDRVLAMALRAGCTRAVRVDDSQIGDVDYLGVAQVLAATIKKLGARLVVCGDRSGDEGTGAVGPAIAELLGTAHVTAVTRVAVEGDHLVVVRRGDDALQRVRVEPPVVLCVAAPPVARGSAPEPRPDDDDDEAPRRVRVRVRTPPPAIDDIDLEDLGIDARAIAPRRTSAGRLRQVRTRGATTLSTSAADLVARLREDRLLDANGDAARGRKT